MTVSIQVELPDEVNKKVEVFKAVNDLQSKEIAIIKMLETIDIKYNSK